MKCKDCGHSFEEPNKTRAISPLMSCPKCEGDVDNLLEQLRYERYLDCGCDYLIKEAADRIEELEVDLREVLTNPGGEYYNGLHCGVEDRDIADHYEAADYGWDSAFEYIQSITQPPSKQLPKED